MNLKPDTIKISYSVVHTQTILFSMARAPEEQSCTGFLKNIKSTESTKWETGSVGSEGNTKSLRKNRFWSRKGIMKYVRK